MIVLVVPFVMLAALAVVLAARSLGPYSQVVRRPTQPIGSITRGPVEVCGALRARGATVEALDGTPCVAVRTSVSYTYRSGDNKTYSATIERDDLEVAEIEIADATGACTVDPTSLMLLGVHRTFALAPKALEERAPALWDRLPLPDGRKITAFTLEQTIVAEGASGFCSGEAMAEQVVASGDYRGGKERYRITASPDRPVILAPFDEAQVKRVLLRPAHALLAVAALALSAAAAVVAAWITIGP